MCKMHVQPRNLSRREELSVWLQSNKYEMIIAIVLCFNVLWMALELQVAGHEAGAELGLYSNGTRSESWNVTFLVGDVIFTTFFCLDVTVRIIVIQSLGQDKFFIAVIVKGEPLMFPFKSMLLKENSEDEFLQSLDELFGCGGESDIFGGSFSLLHNDFSFADQSNAFSPFANRKVGACSSNGPHD